MSDGKKIFITISSDEIEALKEEIKEYIIEQVDITIDSKMQLEKGEERLEELKNNVQDTFTKGTDLKTGNTDRNNHTPQARGDLDVKEVCSKTLEGVWVPEVAVKVLDEGEEFAEDHKILQKGILLDRGSGWKFDFCIFKKSRRLKLEKNKCYIIGPVVSSVYEGSTEFHLNAKTHIKEVLE